MPHAAGGARKVISAQIQLSPAEHERLLRLAAHHERSARAEAIWAVRQWLDQHAPISEAEDTAS